MSNYPIRKDKMIIWLVHEHIPIVRPVVLSGYLTYLNLDPGVLVFILSVSDLPFPEGGLILDQASAAVVSILQF
jgi:hypothetical protein